MENTRSKKLIDFVSRYYTTVIKLWPAEVDVNPARALKEGGFEIPDGFEVRLNKDTDKVMNFTLPCIKRNPAHGRFQ